MSETVKTPRGTHDVLPAESAFRQLLESSMQQIAKTFGYSRIETPIFEQTELFKRGVGESTDVVQKEMYTFEDRGGRSVTLRPELTAGIARSYIQHGMHKLPQPQRFWYLGPCFRYERTQAGRQRQFWQIGIEALGSDDPLVDAEGIVMLDRLLKNLGIANTELRLGTLGGSESRAAHRQELVAFLQTNQERLSVEVRDRMHLNPLRAFDSDDESVQELMTEAPLLIDFLTSEDQQRFETVKQLLTSANVEFKIDPTLVRGLDYYSQTLFEFTSSDLGAQSGVGGGGRYDGLVEQLGGQPTPGFGWAAGIERLALASGHDFSSASDEHSGLPAPDLYIVWDESLRSEAFMLALSASDAGIAAVTDAAGRGMKGQLRRASRSNATTVVVLKAEGSEILGQEGKLPACSGESADSVRQQIVQIATQRLQVNP